MALRQSDRLSRDKWADAALMLLAREGVAAMSIERLANDLGVTKGSAYHHFRSRDELINLALARWEHEATGAIIEQLSAIPSPTDRLRAILSASVGRNAELGLEYRIISAPDDIVTPYVKRVTITRLAFLEQIYLDFGLTKKRAAIWARTSYASYLGVQLLRHSRPDDPVAETVRPDYIDELMRQLTPSS